MKQFKYEMWILSFVLIGLLIGSCGYKQPKEGIIELAPPKIGIVSGIEDGTAADYTEGSKVISLSNAYTFEILTRKNITVRGNTVSIPVQGRFNVYPYTEDGLLPKNEFSIDKYEELVKEYAENNYKLSTPLTKQRHLSIVVSEQFIDNKQLQNGDILITAGPGFVGVFSPEGKIKYAYVQDYYTYAKDTYTNEDIYNYYNYKDVIIEAKPDASTVNFKINDDDFTLSPGQSYSPKNTQIKSINLISVSEKEEKSGLRDEKELRNNEPDTRLTYLTKEIKYKIEFV